MYESVKVLKPCPFCGSANVEYYNDSEVRTYVACCDCGASIDSQYSSHDVVEAWNRRVFGNAPSVPRPIPVPQYPSVPVSTLCKVCGIDFAGKAWGYVCYHSNCPTKITTF